MPPPPPPLHTLRTHNAPIASIAFSADNAFIYAGDQDGYISVTDAKTRRAIAFWQAHTAGVLGVQEWDGRLISHGRDNVILVHEPIPPHRRISANQGPGVWKSLPVNALNFCRFALMPLAQQDRSSLLVAPPHGGQGESSSESAGEGTQVPAQALLAVPGLLDSELCDIYHLPSLRRLHAGVNASVNKGKGKGKDDSRTGLIMAMHLSYLPDAMQERGWEKAGLVIGYEDGRVEMWAVPTDTDTHTASPTEEEGVETPRDRQERWKSFSDGSGQVGQRVWEKAWEAKGHNEAVMGMAVSSDFSSAYTVSADHLLMKHDLLSPSPLLEDDSPSVSVSVSLRSIGHSSLAISANDAVLAVGGWDGRVRLFSARSLKSLGTLRYHREGVQALAFASAPAPRSLSTSANTEKVQREGDGSSTIDLDFVSDSASAPTTEVDDSDSDSDTSGSGSNTETEEKDGKGASTARRSHAQALTARKGKGRGEAPRGRWLVSGAKDRRVAIWGLMDFGS